MPKLPWMKFCPGDFMQDTVTLSLQATGAWIKILCAMWRKSERGKLTLSIAEYCRLLGAPEVETMAAIDELVKTGISDTVTEANKNVTLICRRMTREHKTHLNNALRQQRFRVTRTSNANITGEKSEVRSQKSEVRVRKEAFFEFPIGFTNPEFMTAWEAWKAHRKEIKKPLTTQSIKMQMKDFEAWGITRAIAAIEHTVKKGWQGIREPDAVNNPSGPTPTRKLFPNQALKLRDEWESKRKAFWSRRAEMTAQGERLPDDRLAEYEQIRAKIKEYEGML